MSLFTSFFSLFVVLSFSSVCFGESAVSQVNSRLHNKVAKVSSNHPRIVSIPFRHGTVTRGKPVVVLKPNSFPVRNSSVVPVK